MLEDKAMHYDDDEVVRSEEGSGQTFGEIVTARLSRRGVLGAAAAGLLLSAVPGLAQSAKKKSPTGLNFEPIPPSTSPEIVLSKGYKHQVVVRWGDPLFADVVEGPVEEMTPERQAKCFGYNNDFVGFMPLPFGRERSDHGLLAVNHEYVNPELMFDVADPEVLSKNQVEICLEAVGFAVVEIKRERGQWRVVKSKKYNKRWTGTSTLRISGPAAGDARMKTAEHPEGKTCTGTFHNCAAGKTPWGTVLSGEENFQGFYGLAPEKSDPKEDRSRKRYGVDTTKSAYGFERQMDRFDVSKTPNEPNHFGWVVEIDPYDPDWTPVKRTTLGRFRHEAATAHITKDKQVVMYSGDDSRFEYVYKFVCEGLYNAKNRKANRELLDKGQLYVAKFNADGSGEWLPLVHGQGPLTSANGLDNQADVLIDARIAADLLGATKMDRPEDIEVNPVNEKVYIVCTNNTQRGREGQEGPTAANPRSQNRHGHIIELTEKDGDHTAATFTWELFLVCGDPADEATHYAGFDKSKVSPISCPDNICFDAKGNLWIATDGQEGTMKTRDGFFAVPTEGPERGYLKQIMATVEGSEVCGPEFTPDNRSAFLAIQHPGERSTFAKPSTSWPDGKGIPRPSIIVMEAEDGRVIGE